MTAALTHPASKLSKTSLRLDAFVCYILVIKRMKFKTHLVFEILVVAYGFMDSHKDMTEQTEHTNYQAFFHRGKCKFSMGELCSLLMVNAATEAMPTCYRLTFKSCQSCLPNFKCF